ncbi:MAG: tRNA glutamyl-Q(34) synthetase GluQRS [Acidimicrobiales bacterium]
MTGAGRFAPSPTGDLHVGNLRTAVAAWLLARGTGRAFRVRFEDLDGAVRPEHETAQLRDLAAIGVDWDGEPMRQSDRLEVYRTVLDQFRADDLVYPCFCTRKEIREAASAPNGGPGSHAPILYPGTCRHLDARQRAERERATGRPPAWRLRADVASPTGRIVTWHDDIVGEVTTELDDYVVERFDGVPGYNLVVVVDDDAQDVDQVVRADDLVESTARQLVIAGLLDVAPPSYAHVPLVLGGSGQRLAKRDGAITLADRLGLGDTIEGLLAWMTGSLGLEPSSSLADAVAGFDPATTVAAIATSGPATIPPGRVPAPPDAPPPTPAAPSPRPT